MECICHYPTKLCSRCNYCNPYEYHGFMGTAEKCICHGLTLDDIKQGKYRPCRIEKGCEYYYGYDGKRKHMKYHEKKCDKHNHEWIVKADSVDKKYYECEWCEAEMQEVKA